MPAMSDLWRPASAFSSRSFKVSVLVAFAVSALLGGCDVLLVSPSLPGLFPGLGQPLHGQVLDALTDQPIGHASVMGDLGKGDVGWATTDNDGNFSLYGDISRRVVSISRAGYTSATYEDGGITDGRQYYLSPLFPQSGNYHIVQAVITGQVDEYSASGPQPAPTLKGTVFFGSYQTNFANGVFAFPEMDPNLPGNVYSGVLGGGELAAGSQDPSTGGAFSFKSYGNTMSFDYQIVSVPFADSATAGSTASVIPWPDPQPLELGRTFARTANVSYSNIGWASQVETDISIDFGLLGSLLVARQYQSQQSVAIPSIGPDYRYILDGKATSADGSEVSEVSIATDDPSKASFTLLSPPKPTGPATGAKGVGAHPVFSWDPVAGADSYVVKVIEQGDTAPKWEAAVDGSTTAIGYPWWSDGDINGGALIPGASYSWDVYAISSAFEGTSPSALDPNDVLPAPDQIATGSAVSRPSSSLGLLQPEGGPIFAPYRQKTLESYTSGMWFMR